MRFTYAGGFGANNCGHSEDVGVRCRGPDRSLRCVESCGDGFYDDKGICRRCSDICHTCQGKRDHCFSCLAPYFLEFTNCVTKCRIGTFGNTKTRKCEFCAKECQTCYYGEKNFLCKSCPEGSYLSKCDNRELKQGRRLGQRRRPETMI